MEDLHRISTGFIQAKILLTGAELRVFDIVAGEGASAEEVARRIGGELRGTEILLDALTAMQVLKKNGGLYRLRAEYEPHLREDSPTQLPSMLRHRNRMFRHWAFLESRITGRPSEAPKLDRAVIRDPEANRNFIRAMYCVGREGAAAVVDAIDLTGVRTLADLGGGPGHLAEEFARRSERIEPWLIDLPLTIEVAREILEDSPVSERIRMMAWNFYDDEAPADLPLFDLIFISQVLHAESPERNVELFRRLDPLLPPGGRIVVHEKIVEPDRTTPTDAALFAVNMLAMTRGGRTYTEGEIADWGREAGFAAAAGKRVNERSFLVELRRQRD